VEESKNLKRKITNLVLVTDGNRVLLGKKKRGFGVGKWNGFGGKVEKGETIEGGAKRETLEEAGIRVKNLIKIGVNDFSWEGKEDEIIEVNIFTTNDFLGDPVETEEMFPKWFYLDEIPFKEMWVDDVFWFPLFLSGKKFKGKFVFDKNDAILEKNIEIIDEI
jgi:8-oxo-dGTP diphosphatase/2-hydroxy-dATP diphosphatase